MVCGDRRTPVLRFYTHFNAQPTIACVKCISSAVDATTGWKTLNSTLSNLAVSQASERFRHPERFVAKRPGRPRKIMTGEGE